MRALSLEYHDVVAGEDSDATGFPGPGPASYKIPLAAFEAHLDAIGAAARTDADARDRLADRRRRRRGRCSSPSTTAASAPSAASPTPSSAAAGAATSS